MSTRRQTVQVELSHRGPFASGPMLRFLAAHTVPGVEVHDAEAREHTRLVPTAGQSAVVTARFPLEGATGATGTPDTTGPDGLVIRLQLGDLADTDAVVDRVRGWLGLDVDLAGVHEVLGRDPLLAPLLQLRPGLRVPGSLDGFETALFAVLGQQVSLAAARTFAGRLMAGFATVGPAGLRHLPDPRTLAEAGPTAIQAATGITHARARTVHGVAEAVAGGLVLARGADLALTRRELLALPGIGPWTADYVGLRCLGDPDAYLAGDLVLRRVLGVRTALEAERRAQLWRPWRGHALLHLWTQAVFA